MVSEVGTRSHIQQYYRANELANLHPTCPCSIQHLMFKYIFSIVPKTKAHHPAANKTFLTTVFLQSKRKKIFLKLKDSIEYQPSFNIDEIKRLKTHCQ